MHKEELCQAIPRLVGQRVLVLGDVMLDMYFDGDAERISPEAPVPIVTITGERHKLGGAANVAHNIRALGGDPYLVSVCGQGRDGEMLTTLLHNADISANIVRSATRRTIVKTRVMARGQQMLRLDKEDVLPLHDEDVQQVLGILADVLPKYDVLVISDYAKGLMTPQLRQGLDSIVARASRPPRILVDPKPRNAPCYSRVDLMTPNRQEAAQLAHMELQSQEDIIAAGQKIIREYMCKELLITLGAQGMAFFDAQGAVWHIPTTAQAVFDVTGAGDTVIATLALALAAGLHLPQACALANYAAGVAVARVGVVTVQHNELIATVQKNSEYPLTCWVQP